MIRMSVLFYAFNVGSDCVVFIQEYVHEVFSTFENGAVDTKNLILAVASTVVFAIGIIFVFIGLFNIFKPEERQEPGGKKKGVWQFLLGAIFSAGAGLQLAGGFSQAFFGVDNTDAATEWNTEFKDQSGGG